MPIMVTFKLVFYCMVIVAMVIHVRAGATCSSMEPICTADGLFFPVVTSGTEAESGNNYFCLLNTPDPAWFYFEIAMAGAIYLDLRAAEDIDFIIYGPFTSLSNAQGKCGTLGNPITEKVDCSFDPTETETPQITAAQVGEIYVMLITNYAEANQDISLTLAATPQSVGGTNCAIVPTSNPTGSTGSPTPHPTDASPVLGCSNESPGREVIENKIYACPGTIAGGGTYGEEAQALCSLTYHVCNSALETASLGLTTTMCSNIALTNAEFFGTKQSSIANWQCAAAGLNDIWGCAKTTSGAPQFTCENSLTSAIGGSNDWNSWVLTGDRQAEAIQFKLTDASNGGVLCCVGAAMPKPDCTIIGEGGGDGYWISGYPATVSGDPHWRLWNGNTHDFQGLNNKQYYYMHPCYDSDFTNMPFALIGTHKKLSWGSVTGLEYVTLQVFDSSNKEWFIYVSSSIHCYAAKTSGATTVYNAAKCTDFVSGQVLSIDTQGSLTVLYSQQNTEVEFKLTIGTSCPLQLYMKEQVQGIHFLQVQPPKCYRCYSCGLLGSFRRGSNIDADGYDRLLTCNGQYILYKPGWSTQQSYDPNGWTWATEYDCSATATRRLLADSEFVYEVEQSADFAYVESCDDAIKANVTMECAAEIQNQADCCNLIGGSFCDRLQENCEYDACALASGDSNQATIEDVVFGMLTEAISFVCSLPGASKQEHGSYGNEFEGAPVWPDEETTSGVPTSAPTPKQGENTDASVVRKYWVSTVISIVAMVKIMFI